MPEIERDKSIIEHIKNYCEDIQNAVKRFGNEQQFYLDKDFRNTCALCLLQIGELANHLSENFKKVNKTIPWGGIIGMRNIVAHGYGEINLDIV